MPAVFLIPFCFVGAGFSLLFLVCWLIFAIFRMLASAIESVFLPRPKPTTIAQQSTAGWCCQRSNCQAANPAHARYCRRCGRVLEGRVQKPEGRMQTVPI